MASFVVGITGIHEKEWTYGLQAGQFSFLILDIWFMAGFSRYRYVDGSTFYFVVLM